MQSKKISPLDTIRTFYISNELLGNVFKNSPMNERVLKTSISKIIKQSERLSKKDLLTYHLNNDHPRYDNYLNSKWEIKEISLEDCGVWPRMGGLTDKATCGSVVDTAAYVQEYINSKNKLTWDTRRVLYIENMEKYVDIITKTIPIIVFEGGVIRHTKLQSAAKRKMYKRCKYDIDDGNHRAIALALLGKKKVHALVGKRICKNTLLYYDK